MSVTLLKKPIHLLQILIKYEIFYIICFLYRDPMDDSSSFLHVIVIEGAAGGGGRAEVGGGQAPGGDGPLEGTETFFFFTILNLKIFIIKISKASLFIFLVLNAVFINVYHVKAVHDDISEKNVLI